VLIADEVQTGFGRTGKLFAMEHYGVLPDILTSAKSLAGGLPLSAVTGRAEIMDAPAPGGLGGTYAGNPLAIAAAHAVIDVMNSEGLPERGQQLGDALKVALNGMCAEVPQISDIRGLGAMVAVEFSQRESGGPNADFAKRVQAEALKRRLILLTCGVDGNVIRFLFPLTIAPAHFDEAVEILKSSLRSAVSA
jgi:4-aminobutyrate aminotransferase